MQARFITFPSLAIVDYLLNFRLGLFLKACLTDIPNPRKLRREWINNNIN